MVCFHLRSDLTTHHCRRFSEGNGRYAIRDEWGRRRLDNPLIFWNIVRADWRFFSHRLRQIANAQTVWDRIKR